MSGEDIKVSFLDYGNLVTVSRSQLRSPLEKLADYPRLCFCVKVSRFGGISRFSYIDNVFIIAIAIFSAFPKFLRRFPRLASTASPFASWTIVG